MLDKYFLHKQKILRSFGELNYDKPVLWILAIVITTLNV